MRGLSHVIRLPPGSRTTCLGGHFVSFSLLSLILLHFHTTHWDLRWCIRPVSVAWQFSCPAHQKTFICHDPWRCIQTQKVYHLILAHKVQMARSFSENLNRMRKFQERWSSGFEWRVTNTKLPHREPEFMSTHLIPTKQALCLNLNIADVLWLNLIKVTYSRLPIGLTHAVRLRR